MMDIGRRPGLLASVLLAFSLVSCQGFREFLRDPAGDDRTFTGDPTAFVGKEVIVQFRWGEPEMYGAAIRCTILSVDPDVLVVRGAETTKGSYPTLYSKLEELGKLSAVEEEADVFRVRRDDINKIFESTPAERVQ